MKLQILQISICSVVLLTACGSGSGGARGSLSIAASKPLNDTGITLCRDYAWPETTHNNVSCTAVGATQTVDGVELGNGDDPVPAGQDAVFGRDITSSSNSNGDKGFSFIKLDSNGNALAIQSAAYNDAGLESSGTIWSCVEDEVTGLIWEVKNNNGLLRDKDWQYTWYNDDTAENGGSAGLQDTGFTVGADNCFNNARCDTQKYVVDVNNTFFCGGNDWRLPSIAELKTLRHLGTASPAIESDYFPNTFSGHYWVATSRASNGVFAWRVAFDTGADSFSNKSDSYSVRLVRNK